MKKEIGEFFLEKKNQIIKRKDQLIGYVLGQNFLWKCSDYTKAKLNQGINYTQTRLKKGSDYTKAKFNQGINYTQTRLKKGSDYTKAKFNQGINYTQTRLKKGSDYAIDYIKDNKIKTVKMASIPLILFYIFTPKFFDEKPIDPKPIKPTKQIESQKEIQDQSLEKIVAPIIIDDTPKPLIDNNSFNSIVNDFKTFVYSNYQDLKSGKDTKSSSSLKIEFLSISKKHGLKFDNYSDLESYLHDTYNFFITFPTRNYKKKEHTSVFAGIYDKRTKKTVQLNGMKKPNTFIEYEIIKPLIKGSVEKLNDEYVPAFSHLNKTVLIKPYIEKEADNIVSCYRQNCNSYGLLFNSLTHTIFRGQIGKLEDEILKYHVQFELKSTIKNHEKHHQGVRAKGLKKHDNEVLSRLYETMLSTNVYISLLKDVSTFENSDKKSEEYKIANNFLVTLSQFAGTNINMFHRTSETKLKQAAKKAYKSKYNELVLRL